MYKVTKYEGIFYREDHTSIWQLDCASFFFSPTAVEGRLPQVQILGGVEGGVDKAKTNATGNKNNLGIDNWYVKHTGYGYNVEISIPLNVISGTDADGNIMASFHAVSTFVTSWNTTADTPERVYAFIPNGQGITDQSAAQSAPSFIVIKDADTSDEGGTTEGGTTEGGTTEGGTTEGGTTEGGITEGGNTGGENTDDLPEFDLGEDITGGDNTGTGDYGDVYLPEEEL